MCSAASTPTNFRQVAAMFSREYDSTIHQSFHLISSHFIASLSSPTFHSLQGLAFARANNAGNVVARGLVVVCLRHTRGLGVRSHYHQRVTSLLSHLRQGLQHTVNLLTHILDEINTLGLGDNTSSRQHQSDHIIVSTLHRIVGQRGNALLIRRRFIK